MKLQEKHKEFAVKCFARFMTRSEVVDAFIEEFSDDLPQPPTLTECTVEYKWDIYFDSLSPEELDKIADNEGPDDEMPDIELSVEQKKEVYGEYQEARNYHNEKVKTEISNQLRRLNITHRQFPKKYRDLFNQTREQYFNDYQCENPGTDDNILKELETLHGYVKQLLFQETHPKEALKYVNLSHQILKTIVAHNAVSGKQEVVNITSQNVNALPDSQEDSNN